MLDCRGEEGGESERIHRDRGEGDTEKQAGFACQIIHVSISENNLMYN